MAAKGKWRRVCLLFLFLFDLCAGPVVTCAMNPDALTTALAALERSRTPTVVVRPVTPHGPSAGPHYYTTPSIPIKWRTGELDVDEDDLPLNLGVEKVGDDEEAHWGALGFRLPRRTGSSGALHAFPHRGLADRAPRRDGVEVDWDCGIWSVPHTSVPGLCARVLTVPTSLEPASNPCVTRCGHLFCERDLRMVRRLSAAFT